MDRLPILVVEDDDDIRSFIVSALHLEGYQVIGAENGVIALELLRQQRAGLILLDLHMPVMDGWTFARKLKEDGDRVPIVIITADSADDPQAHELSADAQLPKPFDLTDLYSAVKKLYAPRRRHRMTAA